MHTLLGMAWKTLGEHQNPGRLSILPSSSFPLSLSQSTYTKPPECPLNAIYPLLYLSFNPLLSCFVWLFPLIHPGDYGDILFLGCPGFLNKDVCTMFSSGLLLIHDLPRVICLGKCPIPPDIYQTTDK